MKYNLFKTKTKYNLKLWPKLGYPSNAKTITKKISSSTNLQELIQIQDDLQSAGIVFADNKTYKDQQVAIASKVLGLKLRRPFKLVYQFEKVDEATKELHFKLKKLLPLTYASSFYKGGANLSVSVFDKTFTLDLRVLLNSKVMDKRYTRTIKQKIRKMVLDYYTKLTKSKSFFEVLDVLLNSSNLGFPLDVEGDTPENIVLKKYIREIYLYRYILK